MRLLALVAIPLALLASHASAAAPTIPAKDFPSGAQINFVAALDNPTFDAVWGTTGADDPGFHSQPADGMGRTGGWEEEAVLQKAKHGQDFAVFVSTYDSADDAQAAAQDMADTVANYGLTSAKAPLAALHGSTIDNTMVLRESDARWTLYAFTLVEGTTEVEAIVKFRTHHGDGPKDKVDLTSAVNDAMTPAAGS